MPEHVVDMGCEIRLSMGVDTIDGQCGSGSVGVSSQRTTAVSSSPLAHR
jgi:hypothetical protein